MSEKRNVLRNAGIVGLWTLVSRFTGLLRISIFSWIFGATRTGSIFLVAFDIANMTRRVLGEGALSAFIVPVLSQRRKEQGEAAGWSLFNRVLNFILLITFVISLTCAIFSRQIFLFFGAQGEVWRVGDTPETQAMIALGASYVRIMAPYVMGLSLVALMMGACHTLRLFSYPSVASVMLNFSLILIGGVAIARQLSAEQGATWLSVAVLVGVVMGVALMIVPLWKAGWRWRPELNLRDPELLKLMHMMGLATLSMVLAQLNIVASTMFAFFMNDAIKSYLFYSNMLVQFPMALTASAVATAMLPQLTAFLLDGRKREMHELMDFTKRLELICIVPAMLGLMVFGLPIIKLIMQQGRWTPQDSHGTYLALLFYAPGLLALGWARLISPLFYARKDMRTPLFAAAVSVAVNIALNAFFTFVVPLGQQGLAFAFTVGAFVNYAVLAHYMRRDAPRPADAAPAHFVETFWKTMLAALAACGLGWWLYLGLVAALNEPQTKIAQALYLLPTITLVAALYFAFCRLLRVPDSQRATDLILRNLRRKPAPAPS